MSVTPIRSEVLPAEVEARVTSGANSYFNYLVGAQTFHDPHSTKIVHGFDVIEGNEAAIITKAEELVVLGLKDTIRSAVATTRGGLASAEGKFAQHLPHLTKVFEHTYEHYNDRIASLNEAFLWLRPAPFLDRIAYRYLCHARRDKLTPARLLPAIAVSSSLKDFPITFAGGVQRAAVTEKA